MKVGLLVHNPPYQGGIVQYCILLANELKKYAKINAVGFKSLYPPFLYKGKLPKENKSGIQFEVNTINSIAWYNPLSWISAYHKLKNNDVIHIQWVSPLLAPLQYIILTLNNIFAKKPVVITCHNIEPHESTPLDKIFTKKVFSKVDHFIVHAEQNKTRLNKDHKIPLSRIHVIPHGTFEFFKKWSKESKAELKKEFKLEKDKIILFFGYIREYKGLIYLLRALPKVLEKNKDVKLVIAGELWQNWETYDNEIKKAGIKDKIKVYPSYINDKKVHKFFDLADIVVLPYHNTEQTISGPLLISLAFGKPTIVSPVGGIKEFIFHKHNGLISEGGNVMQLANNINLLLNDSKLQKKLSSNAIETNKGFKWSNVAKEIYEVYKKAAK